MWQVGSGLFLGWSLGSNDAANVFGTAVASRMVKFWTAAILCSVFVILGALLEGSGGFETYRTMSPIGLNMAFAAALAAGLTVSMMSTIGLPVSTSQAVVGALVLAGIVQGNLNTSSLLKVVLCWVGTPIGAALITIVLYFSLGKVINRLHLTMFQYDRYLRIGLIVAGSYGAYALGANNVANVTGAFVGDDMLTPFQAALFGSLAIALGVLTYSRKVMMTVGRDLVQLDAYTAFIAISAEAITVHIYAMVGVPVSTSQAIVGAVLGVGLLKGSKTINTGTLVKILFGWLATPCISAGVAYLVYLALRAGGMV
jgi:PiT family inorganic phosphate transporter